MEGKLYKSPNGEHYYLTVNGQIFAEIHGHPLKTINQALSLKNCEAVANGYDLDELTNRAFDYMGYHSTVTPYEEKQFKLGYRIAFREALEILGDKKFSEIDMIEFAKWVFLEVGSNTGKDRTNEQLLLEWKSLQQTEWDVEIVMVKTPDGIFRENDVPYASPKLDADGCLILRRC